MRPLERYEIRHVDLPVGTLIYIPPTKFYAGSQPECVLIRRATPFGYTGNKDFAHFIIIASTKKDWLGNKYASDTYETLRRDLMILEPKDLLLYVNMFVSTEFEAIMKKQPGLETIKKQCHLTLCAKEDNESE
jgi:hypothetical protein